MPISLRLAPCLNYAIIFIGAEILNAYVPCLEYTTQGVKVSVDVIY